HYLLDYVVALRLVDAALAGDQDVEVAYRLASATQRSGGRDLLHPGQMRQVSAELLRDDVRVIQAEAPGNLAVALNRLQDLLLLLLAYARQLAQLALARQLLHA